MENTTKPTEKHNNALDGIIAQRYAEAEELKAAGINPYPNHCDKTHTSSLLIKLVVIKVFPLPVGDFKMSWLCWLVFHKILNFAVSSSIAFC